MTPRNVPLEDENPDAGTGLLGRFLEDGVDVEKPDGFRRSPT
jgi:hypothetical protein